MPTCIHCGRENDDASPVCADCGRPLSRPSSASNSQGMNTSGSMGQSYFGDAAAVGPNVCPECGTQRVAGLPFCPSCGRQVSAEMKGVPCCANSKAENYRIFVDSFEPTSAGVTNGGFAVRLFRYQAIGCRPHPTWALDFHVTPEGSFKVVREIKVFEDPNDDGLCVD